MTHLQLSTEFDAGLGTIAMRPGLDEEAWSVVHGLGINGVTGLAERNTGAQAITELHFDHTEASRLDSCARIIAAAMTARGCEVSFEEPTAPSPAPKRSQHLVNMLRSTRTILRSATS